MSVYSEATQFIDLVAQQTLIRPELEAAILRVLDHGQYIMGPEVEIFESCLKDFSGATHALTCANGTDALTIVLTAWGVGPGDAVFVPSFTYVASAEAPAQLGATPFFVDVCEDSFNIDPMSFKQAIIDCRKMGLNPSTVVAVDLFGQPADVDSILEIARNEQIKVLIDGAQSFGATLNGRRVGSMGDATTTSFFPAKPLGCYGDGGAIFTESPEDAEIINSLRLHGKGIQKYDNVRVGLNSRLDTLQAAILIQKIKLFDAELHSRSIVASRYSDHLADYCKVPAISDNATSAWAQYTLNVEDRDSLQRALKSKGIPTVVYYPITLDNQLGYQHYPTVSSGVSVSHSLSRRVLSVPMHPYLDHDQQNYVIENIIKNL